MGLNKDIASMDGKEKVMKHIAGKLTGGQGGKMKKRAKLGCLDGK